MTPPLIAVFTKNRLNPAYDAARLAADTVAAEAGARTVHYVPQTPDDVGEQKALVGEALAARPAGVVFNPTDDALMEEDLVRFASAGIPVAVFINRMPGPALTFVGSDDKSIGHAVATALIDGIGGKGRIVALDGTPGARTARDRAEGLRRAVAEHPGIELLEAKIGYLQRAPAREAMAALLAAHPQIDGVWTANDMMAFGAVDALAAAGRRAEIVGINGLPEAIAHIQAGTMLASADFSALNIAAIATRAVLRHLEGKPVPNEIMVPAALIDRRTIDRWTVPMAERPCPAWDEIVR
ncbi:sugar ABC transporter substrate-binding protein [soil metagenome]